MGFYDLTKEERVKRVEEIEQAIYNDISTGKTDAITIYFSDGDTYIRKTGYQAIGKIYRANIDLRGTIVSTLKKLLKSKVHKIRQTTINAAGEIGMYHFEVVTVFFDMGLFDHHHSVRNAVIGSLKKMGQKNPGPTLKWAEQYLDHPDKEIRREICHGIELRGRTHPQDILPMLEKLQHDKTAKVRNTLVHVLGQIAYKKGCLETVVKTLQNWENQELVEKALDEIVDVHERYKSFSVLTQQQAIAYIDKNYMRKGFDP